MIVNYVYSNGIRLAYGAEGAGPPIVLISGVGYGRWYWRRLAGGLTPRCRVVSFDNRGAGESDRPLGPYSVPQLAADTVGLIEQTVGGPVALLGHSLGGFVAQEVALARPDLVARLILAGTSFGGLRAVPVTPAALAVLTQRDGDPSDLFRRGMAIATGPGFVERRPEIIAELQAYRATNPVPPLQYAAQVGAGLAHDAEARLGRLRAPTLVISGSHDQVVPTANAPLLAAAIPGARCVILPGLGHHAPLEDGAAFQGAVEGFLEETGYLNR